MATAEKNTSYQHMYSNAYEPVEGVPLLTSQDKYGAEISTATISTSIVASASNTFPGLRRICHGPPGPPKDHVLIRTAGNALQAVPTEYYEQTVLKRNVLGVPVPGNCRGGDSIMVQNPSNRKMVQVDIPRGYAAGQMFFVEMPVTEAPAAGVMPEIPSHELELGSPPMPNDSPHDFVLVQVPEGQTPGSRLQVSLADGRTLMAVVPSDPSIREFYMKVPDSNAD